MRFQVLFHSRLRVLFTFPSRCSFTIGHHRVFSLGGWSPQFQTGFHVPRPTQDTRSWSQAFAYGTITLYGRPFHANPASYPPLNAGPTTPDINARFGLLPVRSPLLRESLLISSPAGTEMFHFPALTTQSLCIQLWVDGRTRRVSPFGHPRFNGCLRLTEVFAACRVLLRLMVPRHPPQALLILNNSHPLSFTSQTALHASRHERAIRLAKSSARACYDAQPVKERLSRARPFR